MLQCIDILEANKLGLFFAKASFHNSEEQKLEFKSGSIALSFQTVSGFAKNTHPFRLST